VAINANSLILSNSTGATIGTYNWGYPNLTYTDNNNNTQAVSDKLANINFYNLDPANPRKTTGVRILGVDITTKDSTHPNVRAGSLINCAVYCRLPGDADLIRVVDSTGIIQHGPFYHTIQSAIDATTTVNGDTVQISANGRNPYIEHVTITKALTLQGRYDNIAWQQHTNDPSNNYETIIGEVVYPNSNNEWLTETLNSMSGPICNVEYLTFLGPRSIQITGFRANIALTIDHNNFESFDEHAIWLKGTCAALTINNNVAGKIKEILLSQKIQEEEMKEPLAETFMDFIGY